MNALKKSQRESDVSYHELITFAKELRAFFNKEYKTYFKLGRLNQSSPDYTYFSLTTEDLKKLKLKYVIVLNHLEENISICLSGQNKSIRKEYWEMFNRSNWNKYHLALSINDSLSIMDHMIVEQLDLEDRQNLIEQVESESLIFINELKEALQRQN